MTSGRSAARTDPDSLLIDIADYVADHPITSDEAYDTARWCLMDSLGCALLALNYPACRQRLGPVVPGATLANGARVPGTPYQLDPVQAAFNIGTMIRWLDYNDTWLAAEWGHPSDNLGAILAVADHLARNRLRKLSVHNLLTAMIKAHEIQGVLALENSFNRVGIDHVLLVRIASTAVLVNLLGGSRQQVIDALSNAFIDGGTLRTYRHAPNTGPRKSWAAGDATSRATRLALMAVNGEMGYPSALSAPIWGFCNVLLGGRPLILARKLDSYVMENVLFKVSYPAEFHAQTAVEAAVALHNQVRDRLDRIETITIETQESAIRIIDKSGPLHNPADRDHCLQYMVAATLIHGTLSADHYEEEAAADPWIDRLRTKMKVSENKPYSTDYLDPQKRSIANAVQVYFDDGSCTAKIEIAYPLGHRRRRTEAIPLLKDKFTRNATTRFSKQQTAALLDLFTDLEKLGCMGVDEFMSLFVCDQPTAESVISDQ